MGRPRAGHARPLQGGGIVLKRLVGSGLDRSGKVTGDGNCTRRHICIPRNYAAAAQRRGGVKTPPYSTDDLRQPIITPAAYIFLSIPTKYEQNKCPAAFWGSRAVLYIIEFPAAQTPPPGRHHTETTVTQRKCFFPKDRKSTRLNSSHRLESRMPSSA